MSLPGYPFSKERYWLCVAVAPCDRATQTAGLLHPLVLGNTSTLEQQSYTSSFSGTGSFLDQALLPGGSLWK